MGADSVGGLSWRGFILAYWEEEIVSIVEVEQLVMILKYLDHWKAVNNKATGPAGQTVGYLY